MSTTKKKKTSSATKSKTAKVAASSTPPRDDIDPRKQLLARVAGSVAAGIVGTPSPSISTAEGIAAVAVDIANEILTKAGLPSPTSTESDGHSTSPAESSFLEDVASVL